MFLHNDEATIEDRLSRDRIARALAEAVLRASPPLVVGIYGSWGVGKTSLMKLMESALIGRSGVETVWFDPWFHQFDTNPEIAMLHAMADGVHDVEEAKKLLAVIGATLGATALRALTGLKLSEIRELGDQYEQEMFQVREKQAKLQEKFGKLIDLIADSGEKRLVIFVDDLDRCTPTTILKILDALKLYLSHAGCVYVVGIDRSVVEKSIKLGLPGMEGYESQYLDKLVQLPFNVPSLGKGELRAYVSSMLPETLSMVAQLFSEGLDGNPRTIKRFINAFLLAHALAETLEDVPVDNEQLGLVLLLQHRAPDVYRKLVAGEKTLQKLLATQSRERQQIQQIVGKDEVLIEVLYKFKSIGDADWGPYLYLSKAGLREQQSANVWLQRSGVKRMDIVKAVRKLTGVNAADAEMLVASAPCTIVEALSAEEAERIAGKLRALGAEVEVRL